MTKPLNQKMGSVAYDGLLVDNFPPADVFNVKIRKGTAVETLKRGTVMALSTGTAGDEKCVILGTAAASNETLAANCILCDDVLVGTEDVNALAYRTGHFARNKIIVKDGHTFSKADEEALRNGGILLSDVITY